MNTPEDDAVFSLPHDGAELLKQCSVSTFRSSGKGGQHVNKTDSAIRLRHLPTGITVTCQRERSQYLNKRIAIDRLRQKLERLFEKPVPRKATTIPYREKRKRLQTKKLVAYKKKMRKTPGNDD